MLHIAMFKLGVILLNTSRHRQLQNGTALQPTEDWSSLRWWTGCDAVYFGS